MARKKKGGDAPKGSPAWMATFSDLMNLLLCFFVLLFSMSQIDAEKFQQVVASLSNSFSIFEDSAAGIGEGQLISNGISQLQNLGQYFNDMGNESDENNDQAGSEIEDYKEQLKQEQQQETEELYDEISGLIEKNKIDRYVTIGIDDNFQFVKISMYGEIMFDSGKADIKSEARDILSKIGDILKLYEGYRIKIEGHTDNVPIRRGGQFSSNLELSTARASSVWEYLTDVKKLNPRTLEAAGRDRKSVV